MKRYLLPILLIAFWSCEDKEEIKEEIQWNFDPLIGGSEIVMEGIWWTIIKIDDSQANWCDIESPYEGNCSEKVPFDAKIAHFFNFKNDGALNYQVAEKTEVGEGYVAVYTDWLSGEWKTSNGTINVDISNHPSPTDILNYFFKDKDYQYETDINNGTLLLFNDKTEILLSVWNDGP